MTNYIKINFPLPQEEIKELRYHLMNHKFFHKPVRVIVRLYDPKSKDQTGMEYTVSNVIRVDWTHKYKNRYVVTLTSKENGINIYNLYMSAIYVKALKCGRIIPE